MGYKKSADAIVPNCCNRMGRAELIKPRSSNKILSSYGATNKRSRAPTSHRPASKGETCTCEMGGVANIRGVERNTSLELKSYGAKLPIGKSEPSL